MANKEVCEVFIEQQIEEALQEGKTPYSIGKELSKWVEQLFMAKMPAETIKTRARRVQEKIGSFEPNAVTHESETEKEGIQEIKPEITHGGKRDGAGRPKKNKVTDAFTYIEFARSQVDRIRYDDPERKNAILWLIDYLEALLRKENVQSKGGDVDDQQGSV